jgi:hypothetical protein
MLRTTVILALSLAASPVFSAEAAAPDAAAPKAVVVEPSHDFGRTPPGPQLTHDFLIRNEGNAPLEILGVAPSCECTVAEFDRVIEPGETGKVTAVVDTRKLTGQARGTIAVRTNELANLEIRLTTIVTVTPLLLSHPGYARWNMVQGEREGTISQTVWAIDGEDFEVSRVVGPDYLHTTFRPALESELRPGVAGSQWRVEATLDDWAPIGPIMGFLEIETTHPSQPMLRVPISGFVRPILHVTPPTGDFGKLQLTESKRAVFHVQNFATEQIALLGVDSTVKGLEVAMAQEEAGRSYRIEVVFPSTMAAGPFAGALRIRTDSKKLPLLEVPLSGSVEKPGNGSAR